MNKEDVVYEIEPTASLTLSEKKNTVMKKCIERIASERFLYDVYLANLK